MNDNDFADRYMHMRNVLLGDGDTGRFREKLDSTAYKMEHPTPSNRNYLPEPLKDLSSDDLRRMATLFRQEIKDNKPPIDMMKKVGKVRAFREGRYSTEAA